MTSLPSEFPERDWMPGESVVFRKTDEQWGGLSNMAPGFPITLGTTTFLTSEALYQAMRFPGRPDVQQMIVEQASPMTAKMKSKAFRRSDSHPNWDAIRVPVMLWCLQLKLAQNWSPFGELLRSTQPMAIVEESSRDRFWGAIPYGDRLKGSNVLGLLLAIVRDTTNFNGPPPAAIQPLGLALRLNGVPVANWVAVAALHVSRESTTSQQGQLELG